MCNNRDMFTTISETGTNESVTLADGLTKAMSKGKGNIHLQIKNTQKCFILKDVLFVPSLSDSLFSVKQHVTSPGNFVHSSNNRTTIAFPEFIHTIDITDEMFLEVEKYNPPPKAKQTKTSQKESKTTDKSRDPHIYFKKMHSDARKPFRATAQSAGYDIHSYKNYTIQPGQRKLISSGIQFQIPTGYYGRIAPRSGLSLHNEIDVAAGVVDCDYRGEVLPLLVNNSDVPFTIKKNDRVAQIIFTRISDMTLHELEELNDTKRGQGGFGHSNKQSKPHTPKPPHDILEKIKHSQKVTLKLPWSTTFNKGTIASDSNENYKFTDQTNGNFHTIPKHQVRSMLLTKNILLGHHHLISSTKSPRDNSAIPKIRIVDKPPTNAPKTTIYSIDQIKKYFGFRSVQNIIQELKATSTNFAISTEDREKILDLGEISTIDKQKRNTNTTSLPHNLGDTVHMDIIFGANTAISGTKYSLFLVDKATRHKFIYPLQSTKQEDIITALQTFTAEINTIPKLLRTDFDHKLMGAKVHEYLQHQNTAIEAAPPHLQNQNGLCERNWRTVLRMARSWLASSLLPSKFWWHALKRATEVSNYVPIKINNILTTPHELAFKSKVDLRTLLPLFSVAYTSYNNGSNSFNSNSCRAILIGRSNKTHAFEFFHPPTNKIFTSATCIPDETIPAGPTFNLTYDGGLYFNKYNMKSSNMKIPTFHPEQQVYIKHPNGSPNIKAEIVAVPLDDTNIYTVQYTNGDIHQINEKFISLINENQTIYDTFPPTLPKWIKNAAKTTIFLHSMNQPSQGRLHHNGNYWTFIPSNQQQNEIINFQHLDRDILSLIETHQIFPAHIPFWKIWQTRQSFNLSKQIARHVSAKGLSSEDVPTLIQHNKLSETDQGIWDAAYAEEYYGFLKNLPAWSSITERQYQMNKEKYGPTLPTMALSTIKYDENGLPKRAKYRIVALGNLDPHLWSKTDCYAPVMSLMELRFITALAVRRNRTLKSGDVKQAFCQAKLPPGENYVLRPPHGCPLTPKQTYWLLHRTLYGLKRSPRHWFDKAASLLKQIGLSQCPNAPCIFKGQIIPNEPPLILGLYVDDFVYFSDSDAVEKAFEKKLSQLTNVDFMGRVSHFLGIKYQWRTTPTQTKVHMSQEAFAASLIAQNGLNEISTKTNITPYRSGYPVDSIPDTCTLNKEDKKTVQQKYRSIVGSLLWLSQGTRPDLATITNVLAKYQNKPTIKHLESAKFAVKYLKSSKSLGIVFDSNEEMNVTSFIHFPVVTKALQATTDANWGPQDQSLMKPNTKPPELELFKTRSISGHLITLHGPVHWSSKRQRITARSSCEAEIYATDECVKDILHLRNIIHDLQLHQDILPTKTKIFNDNMACVQWSKNLTTKGLRYLQIRENAIRENKDKIDIQHISGNINPADIFSKEDKDPAHFIKLRDSIIHSPFQKDLVRFTAKISILSRMTNPPQKETLSNN